MAAFGSLGGLGGFPGSYPTRSAVPRSQVIKSNEEVNRDWRRQLEEVPRFGQELAANREFTNAGASARAFNAGTQLAPSTGGTEAGLQAMERFAREKGLTLSNGFDGGLDVGTSAYGFAGSGDGSHMTSLTNTSMPNPEYLLKEAKWQAEMAERQQNELRQQQAYDFGMMGGNQLNAVMSSDYSRPGFGQVNGMANAYAPEGDLSWTSGLFDPAQGTSGVYGATGSRSREWGLF